MGKETISKEKDIVLEFLEKLVNQIKTKTIPFSKYKQVGEFYIRCQFEDNIASVDITEEEMMKYITLGWYMEKLIQDTVQDTVQDSTQDTVQDIQTEVNQKISKETNQE